MDLNVEITNCPVTGFKRKVKVNNFNWDLINKSISIQTEVSFYDGVNHINKIGIHNYNVSLIASNTTLINEIGEYDYFIQQYGNSPVVLPELILAIIQERDQVQKRFDI